MSFVKLPNDTCSRGKYHTINVPLKRGLTASNFQQIFDRIMPDLVSKVQPDCIVLQAGCDGLTKDPLGVWSLSTESYAKACGWIVGLGLPTLVLGGGGYVSLNAARCWTLCTFMMQRVNDQDHDQRSSGISLNDLLNEIPIPVDCPDWPLYAPDYSLSIPDSKMVDENSAEYISFVSQSVLTNISLIS